MEEYEECSKVLDRCTMRELFRKSSEYYDKMTPEQKIEQSRQIGEAWAKLAKEEAERNEQEQIRRAKNWKYEWEVMNRPFTM